MKILKLFIIAWLPAIGLAQGVRIGNNILVKDGATIIINGDCNIDQGNFNVLDDSRCIIGNGKTLKVNASGRILIEGNSSSVATLSSDGYFHFLVGNLGTIGAQNALFEKISNYGLTLEQGSILDPEKPFRFSVFTRFQPNASMLSVYNSQYLNLSGISFYRTNQESYNIYKASAAGQVMVSDYSGDFTGEDFENDPFGLVFWEGEVPYVRLIQSTIFQYGTDTCTDARQRITLNNVTVFPGTNLELIAGQKVVISNNVTIVEGANFLARIASDGVYCNPKSLIQSMYDSGGEFLLQNSTVDNIGFSLYPNPFKESFTLVNHTGSDCSYVIYNLMGDWMLSGRLPQQREHRIDCSDFRPGIYILRACYGGSQSNFKVVKH